MEVQVLRGVGRQGGTAIQYHRWRASEGCAREAVLELSARDYALTDRPRQGTRAAGRIQASRCIEGASGKGLGCKLRAARSRNTRHLRISARRQNNEGLRVIAVLTARLR